MAALLSPANLALGARFVAALPGFLRTPLDPTVARAEVAARLQRRSEPLVSLVGVALSTPRNPLGALLRNAGCTVADVAELVGREGVEGALTELAGAGVYLTVDEFKGRRPAERGSATVETSPELLRNPRSSYHVPVASSGSRSAGTATLLDLAFIRACAADACLVLDARGGSGWRKATWEVPGAGARFRLLKYASFGAPPVRWFSQLDPRLPDQHPVIRLSTVATRWGSILAGVPLPGPEYAPFSNPLAIARWMREELGRGEVPHLFTFPSSAVALCEAAERDGVEIAGSAFTLGGEPITPARLATVRRLGADALPRYGSIECGPIGYGCLAPHHADEVHLVADLHAVVQMGSHHETAGVPADGLLVTGLHARTPFTMLNVSLGDQGVLEDRPCGCPLETLGWRRRLHNVRSFEKLTGTGMNFLGTDVIHVLEEVLPSRFGGGPTSYQLVEDETPTGRAVLRLLVDPVVGPLDETEAVSAFVEGLAAVSTANRLMAATLRASKALTVERRAPLGTRSGKRLHLALAHRSTEEL